MSETQKIDKFYSARLENEKSKIKIETSCPNEIIDCILALKGADKITIEIIERTETPSWSLSGSSVVDKITDYKIIMKSAYIIEFGILKAILNNFFEVE